MCRSAPVHSNHGEDTAPLSRGHVHFVRIYPLLQGGTHHDAVRVERLVRDSVPGLEAKVRAERDRLFKVFIPRRQQSVHKEGRWEAANVYGKYPQVTSNRNMIHTSISHLRHSVRPVGQFPVFIQGDLFELKIVGRSARG